MDNGGKFRLNKSKGVDFYSLMEYSFFSYLTVRCAMGGLRGLQIVMEDLSAVREKHKRQTIVFCSGAFDLIHVGHVLFFEDCKKCGDILVVEVAHDALIIKNKGPERPVMNESMRMKHVSALKPVDYCFLDRPYDGYPLQFLGDVFRLLHPDVYVINTDTFDIPFRQRLAEEH